MTKNIDKEGLSSIVDNYQLFYVDLWGVVHNGVFLHQEAIKVLNEISKKKKDFILVKNIKKNINKYFILKVFKKNQKYLLIKNTKFKFLKNLTIFPMEELSRPKNFNKNFNFKMSNMSMNIKIQYLKNSGKFQSPYWINEKKLDNYMLPSFTKKVVKYLERNQWRE